ncbi:uncharacterized protein LOC141691540 [Apium graveolens]|uniref:uncharacterized protein LOC141691540 n=1 Tax=Apium graveolens TaxID=4045 RepID=UPI003D7B8BF5
MGEELPWVFWAYRATHRSCTGETPFRMAYGTYDLFTVEVGLELYRTEVYNVKINNFGLRANVDLLEEEREVVHQRNVKYLLQAAQHYDSGIKKRSFSIGDFVRRESEVVISMPMKQGKIQPNREGPYKVIEFVRSGTYKLETLAGEMIKTLGMLVAFENSTGKKISCTFSLYFPIVFIPKIASLIDE